MGVVAADVEVEVAGGFVGHAPVGRYGHGSSRLQGTRGRRHRGRYAAQMAFDGHFGVSLGAQCQPEIATEVGDTHRIAGRVDAHPFVQGRGGGVDQPLEGRRGFGLLAGFPAVRGDGDRRIGSRTVYAQRVDMVALQRGGQRGGHPVEASAEGGEHLDRGGRPRLFADVEQRVATGREPPVGVCFREVDPLGCGGRLGRGAYVQVAAVGHAPDGDALHGYAAVGGLQIDTGHAASHADRGQRRKRFLKRHAAGHGRCIACQGRCRRHNGVEGLQRRAGLRPCDGSGVGHETQLAGESRQPEGMVAVAVGAPLDNLLQRALLEAEGRHGANLLLTGGQLPVAERFGGEAHPEGGPGRGKFVVRTGASGQQHQSGERRAQVSHQFRFHRIIISICSDSVHCSGSRASRSASRGCGRRRSGSSAPVPTGRK